MAQPTSSVKERISLSGMADNLAALRERPTFAQMFGARLLHILLCVICALVVAFLIGWLFTRPTFTQVKEILGTSADPKVVLETLRELRRDHFDHFRDFFQLLVLSGLVPLITLFAGYTFGTRENERLSSPDASGNVS